MSDEIEPIGEGLVEVVQRHCARVRAWQQTPEGRAARARWEREQLARARAERADLCTLRGVPEDVEVRRWALDPHPSGELFEAVREAIAWQREREEQSGGRVPALRILAGTTGTGKTCALAWGVATWPRRARYVTADVLCSSKTDEPWREARDASLLALDELGIEAHPDRVTELLLARWSAGRLTLCGTNLTANEVRERYLRRAGERLFDRLREQRARGLRAFVVATWASYRGAGGGL